MGPENIHWKAIEILNIIQEKYYSTSQSGATLYIRHYIQSRIDPGAKLATEESKGTLDTSEQSLKYALILAKYYLMKLDHGYMKVCYTILF